MLTIPERHYSYECKATAQERPYVSRPSRSQQFRNPKLVPKLTNETLNPLEQKKGVADEELAKLEAERAREREREQRDDGPIEANVKRHGSVSSHSVSTISTGASRSPSPGKDRTRSPAQSPRSRSPYSDDSQRGRRDDSRNRSRSHSPSLDRSRSPHMEARHRHSDSGRSPSPEDFDRRDQYRNIHRSLGVHTAFVVDLLGAQGRPNREADVMKGQIDPGLGMTVRDCHLVEGLMTEDMGTEVQVLGIKHENEA
ncbi:hypothetical protein FACUT_1335 [Fusarium acutatum]|uniref:Uncharacterized protein n=1 Tax=Fusarium acutatum TaxID=78861 RepID=A0A8H4K4M0_9HYPO|nr:hypothetical protein FACUT_1335 [Fusarium acutatum]